MSLGIRGGTVLLSFLSTWLVARLLGSADYGLYAYAMAWYGSLSLLIGLGLGQILIREIAIGAGSAHRLAIAQTIRWSLLVLVGSSVVATVAFALAVLTLAYTDRIEPSTAFTLLLAVALLPTNALSSVLGSVQQGYRRIAAAAIPSQILQPLFFCGCIALCLLLAIGGIRSADVLTFQLMAQVFGLTIAAILTLRLLRGEGIVLRGAGFDHRRHGGLFKGGALMMLDALAAVAQSQLDIIMLGSWLGPDASGPYQVASRTAALLGTLHIAALVPLAPLLASAFAAADRSLAQGATARFVVLTLLPTLPFMTVFVIFPDIVLNFFGAGFVTASPALVILTVAQCYQLSTGPAFTVLLSGRQEQAIATAGLAGLVTSVALNFTLIPWLGPMGAAIANGCSAAVAKTWMVYRCRSHFGIDTTIFCAMSTRTRMKSNI